MNVSTKRLLSILLSLAMVLAMLPMAVFAEATTTVYCQTPDNWSTCKAYWWGSKTGTNPGWPGVAMTEAEDGIWTYDVPSDATGLIFNNGNGTQTKDLKVPTDENVMYVFANSYWTTYGKVEVVLNYFVAGSAGLCGVEWDPGAEANKLADEDGDGIYTITYNGVAAGNYEFKVTNGTWSESWGQNGGNSNYKLAVAADDSTVEISFDTATMIPTAIVNGGESTEPEVPSEEPSEEPSTEPAGPKEYCLVGYINGADYGCNDDYENVGEYIFVDGTVTTSFAADSYIFVKTTDNANWYLAEAYCTDTTCTFVPNASEKMFVPGGVELTFTLVENEDGTVTVSYVTGDEIVTEPTEPEESTESIPTEPVAATYYVVGNFNSWNPADPNYVMNANEDGTYSLDIDVTAGEIQLKVTGGSWDDGNNWGDNGNNVVVNATADGTITVSFDPATYAVTVTGDCLGEIEKEPLAIETIYVAGSVELLGNGWDPASNPTTNTDGVYTLVIENVAAGTYEYKFVANGTWALNWAAGVENVSGESYTDYFNIFK